MPATVNRYLLNDEISKLLSLHGWDADDSDERYDRLNDLTHEVADLIDAFLNTSDPQTEADPDRMEN